MRQAVFPWEYVSKQPGKGQAGVLSPGTSQEGSVMGDGVERGWDVTGEGWQRPAGCANKGFAFHWARGTPLRFGAEE